MRVLVVGDPDTVLAFALGGVEGRAVEGEELGPELEGMEGYGLVLITERLAARNRERIERVLLETDSPLIVEIPEASGHREKRVSMAERIISILGR